MIIENRRVAISDRARTRKNTESRLTKAAAAILFVEGLLAIPSCADEIHNHITVQPTSTAGNGGAGGFAEGGGGALAGGSGGAGGISEGGFAGHAGAGGGELVCTSANNDETSYSVDMGEPLSFAGFVFTYTSQVPNTENIVMNIDCDSPPFSVQTGYVIPHLTEKVIPTPPNKLIRITNNGSNQTSADIYLKVEDAPN